MLICYCCGVSDFLYDRIIFLFFFFFNDPAPPEIYTLSLHDALPISPPRLRCTLVPCLPCAMPSSAHLLWGGHWGTKGCRWRRRWRTPTASHSPVTGSVCCFSVKGTCPGHSPCSNGPWASVETRTFRAIS